MGDVYRSLCQAVHVADAEVACVVGASPFYSIGGLEQLHDLMRSASSYGAPRILYNFNFFVPKNYVMNDTATPTPLRYPGTLRCSDVYTNDHVCKESLGKPGLLRPITVDRAFLQRELERAAHFRDQRSVPVLLDQWGVTRGAGASRHACAPNRQKGANP